MSDSNGATAVADPTDDLFDFDVSDVTHTRPFRAKRVQRSMPAGLVAQSFASVLQLPENVIWTLRENTTSRFLDEKKPIGEQIGPDSAVTLTPKTHLGGATHGRRRSLPSP